MYGLLSTYSSELVLVLGMLLTAALVNRFAPQKRSRLRRIWMLFLVHLLALGLARFASYERAAAWVTRLTIGADLFGAFAFVNVGAVLLLDVVLPRLKVELASITTDLAVGISYIFVTLAVLRGAGLNPTEAVATGAVVSAVIALSLQSTLGNILGGVALQVDGSIKVGDWVQLDNGKQGKVTRIRWRHTVVETRDFDAIIVPNASLLASNITVLGRRGGRTVPHRMWVYFHVDHRFSPGRVIDVVRDALHAAPIENVAADPKPNVICYDLGHERRTSFALYAVRYFLTDLAVDDPTSSAIRVRIHAALRRAEIPLAMPATAVFVSEDDERRAQRREDKQHRAHVEALRGVEFFRALSNAELESLAPHLRYAPFGAGETMTRQGAVAHWLYIMCSGRAEVRTSVDGNNEYKVLSVLEAPSFFGEMGLMTGEPRQASVVALTEVDCYRLEKSGFQRVLQERPEIANELSTLLAHRKVELIAARDGLSHAQKQAQEDSERERILGRIQEFFGL